MKKLAEHQRYAINMMEGNEALAIFYEAGTGKTAIALTYIRDAVLRGDIHNALIICPAPLVDNWRNNIEAMIDFESFTPGQIRIMKNVIEVVSINSTWKRVSKTTAHRDGTKTTKRVYKINPKIDHPWDCVIIDESHCLGDPESVQTKTMIKFAAYAKRRYIMTGTPDCGAGCPAYRKLYGQIKFLKPDMWDSYAQWRIRYVRQYNRYNKPIAYDDVGCEELKRQFGIVARLRDCFDMPGYTETLMECPLAEPKVYRDVLEGRTKQYGLFLTTSGVSSGKLLQVVSGHLKTDDGVMKLKTSKLSMLEAILEGTEDKVVVFCNFIESIEQVAEFLQKSKISFLRYDGSVKEPLYLRFQEDPSIKVFLAQYAKGGTGADLYASHTCVYYEPTRIAIHLEQSKARIMRKGQTQHCRYIYLVTPGTVEAKTLESVRNGVDVSAERLNEWAAQERMA